MNFNNIGLRSLLVVLVCSFAVFTTAAKDVFYVKAGAEGDGASWSNAFGNIQQAVDSAAKKGADVWVAKGTYTSDASAVVNLKPNVSLYGGFAGTETSLAERDTAKNPTVLDGKGKIQVINQPSEFPDSCAVLIDGFTIQNGYSYYGGGAYLRKNSTVSNCIFKDNRAISNAMAIYAYDAKITNCIITHNDTLSGYCYYTVYLYHSQMDNCDVRENTNRYGNVYATYYSSINKCRISKNVNSSYYILYLYDHSTIQNSEIFDNQNSSDEIVYLYYYSSIDRCKIFNNESIYDNILDVNSNSTVSNSLIYSNKTQSDNVLYLSSSRMMNTTFVDNETDYPTYLYLYDSPVINSIVVGNKASLSSMYPVQLSGSNTIGNSMFDVPVSGGNVIIASKENAAFKDPENGDYSLTEKSYCINRGCDIEYTADLYGNARKQKGAVDMGAIESSYDKCALPSYGDIVYVKAGSNGDGSSWKSAFGDVSQAVKMVSVDGKKHQIWVAAGTYYGDTLSAVSLYLHDGISLYGGFAGNETSLASRDTAKNRTILDGMKARCVIAQISSFADSMSVTVDGFTIQNGASSSACALKISGGVTINNCIIKENVGPKIYGNSTIDAAYAIIKNTKIINNRYETCYNYYTARLDHCVMDSCDLINNSAYYYGAVYADYSEITNCKIDGNISTGSGNSGSYFNYTSVSNCRFANASGSGATVSVQSYSTLKECLFENNTAINRYLIYQSGTNSLVEDCKFINNSSNATLLYVVKGKINRCTIKGDSTTSRLIEASNAGTIISNCLICDNVSTSTTEQPISLNKEASMINCTVVNNETGSNYVGLISNSTLKNSIIVGNKTNIADGNVLTQSGVNSISNNMLENYVSGGNLSGNMEYAAFKDAENGDYSLSETSYCINAGTSVSDSLDLNGNPRTQMGSVDLGAIESQFDRTKVPTMSEIIYVKSGSEGDGSSWNSAFGDVSQAIKVASLDGKRHQVWVAAGTYYGDTLSTYPSIYLEKGISLYGGFAGTETSIAQRDTAKNPTILDGKGKRGVIIQNYPFADSMAVIVDGFTIQNGYATTGAGVNIKNNTTVSNCIVKNNLVTGNGSAVYAFNASVKNSKIFNNTGSYSNVAVYLQNAIMDSCDVRNNTSYYGTVLNASKNSTISGCTFEANNMSYSYSYSSSYRGIRVDSSNVKNCKFINSNGLTASVWLTGNSVMSGCLFDGNTSSSNLVYVQSGNALIEDCKFLNNKVSSSLLCLYSGSCKRCLVKGDTTSNRLIEMKGSSISNSLICNNVGTNSSYELVYIADKASMYNCTVVDNETKSNVFYMNNATLVNTIAIGNKSVKNINGIVNQGTVANSFANNMLEHTFLNRSLEGKTEYAAFTDAANGDYSLSENSFCINAGLDVADSVDFFGNPRKQGGAVDMGAIESAHTKSASFANLGEIIYVKAGSDGDGSSWTSAFGEIQPAIFAASTDGKKHQIWVAAGTYYGDSTLSSVVNLVSGVSLYGGFAGTETTLASRDTAKNPTILDGKSAKRVISQNYGFADSMAVVVDGFTIQNGKAASGAGAYINGNTTISNCIIKANTASSIGSAVYATNATIKKSQIFGNNYTSSLNSTVRLVGSVMDSCVVKNNKAYYNGAVYAEKNSKVSNCEFEGNSCYNNNRGSYFNASEVSGCKFVNSTASASAIDLQGVSVMSDCLFEKNTNVRTSLVSVGKDALIKECKILDNTATSELLNLNNGKAERCLVKGNNTSSRLVMISSAAASMTNSLICNNVSTYTNDGAVYINNGASMINCTVVSNDTKCSYVVTVNNGSTLKNSIFVDNKKGNRYNGTLTSGGTNANTISNNMFESTFVDGNLDGSLEYAAFTDAANGDYSLSENSYCINAGAEVSDSLDYLGNARVQSNAVDMGAFESKYTKAPVLTAGEIVYVKSGSDGDGSSWTSAFGDIQEAIFAASLDHKKHQIWVAAGTYYGDSIRSAVVNLASGISLYGGFAGDETSLAARDTAKNPTVIDGKGVKRVLSQNFGFADSLAVVVDGFTIQNGYAESGAGISVSSNTTISNCIIKNNKASSNGSAIYAYGAVIKNSQISDNTYTSSMNGTVRLSNSVMDSCVVKNNKGYYYGAINADNNSKVTNCEIVGNSSSYNKGSYFNSAKVSNCKFINTSGIGSTVELQGSTVMDSCLFEGNTNVGTNIIYVGNGALAKNCQIIDNKSTSTLVNLNYGKINRCLIQGNTASYRLIEMNYSPALASNTMFVNNICTQSYEPIYMYNASMINCTVVRNETKHGNVVYMDGSTLKNSIIVGNKTNTNYSNVLNLKNSNTIANNMLEATYINGNIDGSMTYAAFVDPENGDFSLSETSYCINAGAEVSDSLDFFGNARKQGGAVDMGAIESEYEKSPFGKVGEIIYVKAGSEGDGSSWASAFGEIQDAILAASADGEKHQVWVAAGTYYGDTTLATVVNLAPGISLYGGFAGDETSLAARDTAKNPTILDGKNARRVITQDYGFADSMAVVVDGFTIQNGSVANGGGANISANTTLSNCIVKGNKAIENGSAIYASGAVIKNTQIFGNTYQNGLDYTIRLYNCVMDSCEVRNNKSYYHGAITADGNSVITNCVIEGNTSAYSKSGYRGSYFKSSNVRNCKFINTDGAGSAVELQGTTVMDSCLFEGNTTVGTNIIYVGNGSLAENCQIIDNKSTSTLVNLNYGKINRCLIKGNTASYRLIEMNYSPASASNTMFVNNICTQSYEPIYMYNASMINCTVVRNETKHGNIVYLNNSTLKNSIVVGNKKDANNSFILNRAGTNTIVNNMLEASYVTGNIDGSMTYAAFTDPENGDFSLSEKSFCINAGAEVADSLDFFGNPRSQGGAVDMGAIESEYTKAPSFTCGEIVYVKSGSEGDGSSWKSAFGDIQEAVFAASADGKPHQVWVAAGTYYGDTTINTVVNLAPGISLYGGFAGDETSLAARDTAKNPTVIDGKGVRRGISQNLGFADSMSVVIDGFTIQNGKATTGAGVSISTNTTVSNCIIRGNKSSESGSAVYATNATIKNSQISDNTYTSSMNGSVRLSNCVMDSCVVKNNKGYYYGAINADNNSKVTNCEIVGNSSSYNKGSYFNSAKVSNCKFINTSGIGSTVELQGSTVMDSCLFEGNKNVNTNIIYVGNSGVLVEDCQILNNTSNSTLFNLSNGKANRCLIKGNTTSNRVFEAYYSTSVITNSLFCNNICTSTYEPFYLYDRTSMINCTVAANEGKHGNVIYLYNSTLKNSIVVGNKKDTKNSFILNRAGTNTIVNNMLEASYVTGNIDGSMTYAAFTDPENGDFSLSEKSFCINAGAEVADSLDFFGNPRSQGGAVDMGAIESEYTKAPSFTCGEIVYVKSGSEGDGSSWKSAFGDIQEAVFAASTDGKPHQVWVAAGTYYGDTTLNTVVNLAPGISLYGGFAGDETSLAARDTAKNPTVIDGKGVRRGITSNMNFADSMAVVIDGFTIQNGYATNGGGVSLNANITLNNCIVKNCHVVESGSAIYSSGANVTNSIICYNGRMNDYYSNRTAALYFTSGKIDSCVVKNNYGYNDGAIKCESTTITNTLFEANACVYYHVIELAKSCIMSDCKIVNNVNSNNNYHTLVVEGGSKVERCLIDGNNSYRHIIYVSSSSVSNTQITNNKSRGSNLIGISNNAKIINCTIADNESSSQTIYGNSGTQITNTIIVGNKRNNNSESIYVNGTSISYSMIEGGANGVGNIDGGKSGAAFENAAKGDYSLSATSLCINAGTEVSDSLDLKGNARTFSDAVDMGAIESPYTERSKVGTVIYVKSGSEGSGTDWDDALGEISDAISLASSTGRTHQIWVAAGTYYGDTSLVSAISLSAGVSLYGGFAGTETSLDERDAAINTTVIDGRYKRRCIIQNYDFADSLAIVVDGFTIQNGYMKSSAGVNAKTMSNTTFSNCIFRNAREGNECVYANKSAFKNCKFTENLIQDLEIYSGVVDSCSFSGNTSTQGAKVVYINNTKMSNSNISGHKTGYGALDAVASSEVSNCKIFDNKALYDHVVYIENSTLQNSYVYGNVASYSGYSIIIANYNSFITNSTVAHNTTKNRSAISYTYSSSKKFTTIANSIIYGNKITDELRPQAVASDYMKIKYSASDGDLTGEKNIKLATSNSGSDESQKYVCFINAAGGDYRLHATSSCIDKGLDSVMAIKTDINGGARIYGKAIDLGASEFDGEYVQMLDYSQVICHNGTSLEATFDSTISKIDWIIEYAGHVTGFEETSGTGLTIPAMQLNTSKIDVDTLTLKVTPYDNDGVAGTVFNYNYFVYPDFSKKKVTFARPQVAYVVNEQNTNMSIEWNLLKLPVEVDNYDLYVWKASQNMPTVPMASYVKDHVKNLSGLDNHTTYKYMVKAAIACDTICSDVDSFRIDIPVSLEVNGNINCVFGSKLNETSSLTRYVKGFELTDSITYEITGKDAADFSAKYENGWDKLNGGYLRIYYTPTDVKKQTSDAEITIRSGKSGKYEITLYLAGTLSNYYVYDAVVAKDVYHAGDTVDVVGILTDAYGNPMSGKTLSIEATSNTGFSHSTTGVTDSTGMAAVSFGTTKNECGTYTVKVYIGSKSENAATAKFDIPGMAYTGGTTKWTIQKGDTIDGTITITNRSSVDLHNLVVEARELAEGLSVEFDTVKLLKGSESARISFKATGTKLTEGKMYLPSVFRVSNDENTTCDFSTYFYCEHPYGQIKVWPTDINEYVSKQKAKYINIELTNAGFGETGDITLSMPDFAGFSVPTTKLPSIKSGDTARVALKLAYYPGAPINVPFTGSIGVNCANGKSTSLPFRIEYSSESKGSLEVDVVDEYYYNTADKKHLNGAKVVVRNQYNNKEVASGISDSTGVVKFDSIPEGSYLLSVKADKHSEYQETIEIQAGQQLDKFVFLAYQAITYNWKVERVEIEDKYDITLDLEYETNIPAPVVTLSFPNGVPSKDRFEIGVPKTVRLQITNHGLVAARYVKFGLPKSPYYRFYAPYNYIDSLPANHTEFVPITIVRTADKYGSADVVVTEGSVILEDGELYGESECPSVHAEYSYVCGVLRKLSTVSENAWGCPYLVPVGGGGYVSGGFDIPAYGGSTGGGYNGNVQNHGHAVNWDLPCNSCASKVDPWGCIGNVLGYVPIIGPALEWGTGKLHDAIKEDSENRKKRQSCEVQVDEKDDWFESLDTPINDYTFDKNTPEDLKNKIQTVRSVYNVNVDAPKGGDDDDDDEFISASIGDLQTIYTGTKLVCKGINGELDPYEGVDFVWDQAKDILGDKVKIPYVKSIPWDCIDLACQMASCDAGRYAENCGRYLYDRIAGNNEEDEDTREALTDEGDVVEIENGQIKDIRYADGTRLSDEKNTKSEKMEKAKAPFRMKNSTYKMADAHTLAVQDAVEFTGMLKYKGCMMKELAGSESALSINGIVDYFDYTIPSYTNRKKIDIDSIKKLPTMDLSTTEMVEMAQRWNETLVANENGVYSPNEQYPNIVDYSVISAYMDSIVNFYAYMTFRGFDMVNDMLVSINKEANKPTQKSVCASVKLQISQTLTMTREAFDGTLTVNNGNESGAMEGFKVVLEVRNDKGELSNDLFQINTEKLTGVTAVDGTGEIAPKSEGTALFRFIPEKGAAPKAPVNYSFGGYIVYVDPSSGDTVKADLYPVTLTVNPSPDLQIDYFMQRNILGDDALTLDRVEPSVPAALGVRIDNQGYGDAKKVKLETAQPVIVDNEKGLLIDFAIIGSSLNGKDCDLGSENIDFGNIEALSAKTGVWWMTSSLLGHFTKYEASVVHANSFGNPDLSLVKGIAIHELIKTVDAYGVKEDNVTDFLVNDIEDENDTPDALYYSNGGKDTVVKAQYAKLDKKKVTASDTMITLTVTPSNSGWNYVQMEDPGDNCFEIQKVVRVKDSVEIPLDNVWTTFVNLPDGAEPIYVNRLHFLDYMTTLGENDYNIYYSVNKNVLNVAEILGTPKTEVAVTSPVDSVIVKFDHKIQKESFDYNDIELFCQGGDNLSDSTITVAKRDDYTYVVNIASKTTKSGFYKIEVNVNNVYDQDGYPGNLGKNATWSQLIDDVIIPDTIVSDTIVPVNPDTIVPVNPDTIVPVNPDTIVPVNPDTIVPITPDTTVTDTITPVIPDTIVPITPDTTVTDTITPVIPDTIVPITPDTTVTDTITPVIPDTIVPVNPDTIVPVNPDTIVPVIPDTIVPVIPDTIVPVNPDTIVPVIPDTIVPVNPDTIVPVNPDTIVPVNPDTIVPVNPDTIVPVVPDTIVPVIPDTIVPVVPDTIVPVIPDTIVPVVPDTIVPVVPDTIVSDTTGNYLVTSDLNDEFTVYAYQNCVYVKSTKSGTLDIYDILSRLIVKNAEYGEGVTMVATLPKGIYIIEGKKIIVR